MDEKEMLDAYNADRQKFVESLRKVEGLLTVLCQTVAAMPAYDRFWLDTGYGHIKQGIMGLMASVSSVDENKALEVLKARQQEQLASEDAEKEEVEEQVLST